MSIMGGMAGEPRARQAARHNGRARPRRHTSEAGTAPERRLVRRRSLPGGRAVVGGFLIAAAAVGIFSAYVSATRRPRQWYVVASRTIPAGARLAAGDLRVVALDLPDTGARSVVFGSTAPLIGASVIAPITSGALIESSAVVGRGGPPGSREVSISIDRSRAVAGTLKPGEYVDLLGTFGTGGDDYTAVMVSHVQVIALANQSSSLGDLRTQLITFAAPTEVSAEAVADAAVAAQLTLVRSAEPGGSTDPGADTPDTTPPAPVYRAPGPPATRSAN